MFCPNCGQPLSDNAKFCSKCGTPVTYRPPVQPSGPAPPEPEPTPAPPIRKPEPEPEPEPAPAPPEPTPAPAPTKSAEKRSSVKQGVLAGAITALAILILAFTYMYTRDLLPFLPRDNDSRQSEDRDGPGDPIGGNDIDREDSDDSVDSEDKGDVHGESDDGGGAPADVPDPYEDSVDPTRLVSAPAVYVGQRVSVNATVGSVFYDEIRADVTSQSGQILPIYMSLDSAGSVNQGDSVYIEGGLYAQNGDFYYLSAGGLTFTGGTREGERLETNASIPIGTPETVTEYTAYSGSFASVSDASAFLSVGGPLVTITVDSIEHQLYYTVTNYNAATGDAAQIGGAAFMDGAPGIYFSGDDGWGNLTEGWIYLMPSGAVYTVCGAVTNANTGWDMDIGAVALTRCSGSIPQLYEPRPDHTQEVIVSSRGSSATLTLRNWDHGRWTELLTADASLGANGINYNKVEGDKCTPAGTFDILFAFGAASRTLNIDYYKIKAGDVWVDDTNSYFYNTMQTTSTPGKDWTSAEDLYNKFTNERSVGCIYFNYNGDGLTGGTAYYKGGSDLFIDGLGAASSMGPGYGDIRVTASDFETLVGLLDSSRAPKLIIS